MSVAATSPFRARTGSELAADHETSREQLPARASPSRHNERTRAIGGSGRFCGPVEGIAAALMRRNDACRPLARIAADADVRVPLDSSFRARHTPNHVRNSYQGPRNRTSFGYKTGDPGCGVEDGP